MARKVYIKDRDLFAAGNRSALAVIGANPEFRSVKAFMDADRLEDVQRVTGKDEAYGNIPEVVDGRVGLRNVNSYRGSKRALLAQMPWASVAVLTPVGGFARVDLTGELRWLMQTLIAASSPFTRTGKYRSSFRYVVGRTVQRGLPRGDQGQWTIAGVTNIAAYASALENMRARNIFRRTFTKIQSRARNKNYDVRMDYMSETSELGSKGFAYPSPVIWIGQLNSMRGRTGLQFRKRPPSRRRRWGK
jgi:hypothetical protein